jgi:hypothetical protein
MYFVKFVFIKFMKKFVYLYNGPRKSDKKSGGG